MVPEGWEDREWEVGWEGHERAQHRRFSKLPFAEKIAWLEEAQEMAEFMLAQQRAQREQAAAAAKRPGESTGSQG